MRVDSKLVELAADATRINLMKAVALKRYTYFYTPTLIYIYILQCITQHAKMRVDSKLVELAADAARINLIKAVALKRYTYCCTRTLIVYHAACKDEARL